MCANQITACMLAVFKYNTVTEACHIARQTKMANKAFEKSAIDEAIKI